MVLFARADSGIITLEDLAGHSIVVKGEPWRTAIIAMLEQGGLTVDDVVLVPGGFDMAPFYEGEVDVWAGFLTNDVIRARQRGLNLTTWPVYEYGIHKYSNLVYTSQALLGDNPDKAVRFLRATLRGWRHAIENPDEAVAATLQYDDALDAAHLELVMAAQAPLIHTGVDDIGWMHEEVWEELYQMMLNHGILDVPLDPETVYTMEFLHKVYGS